MSGYFCVCDMLRPVYVQDLALALHVKCLQHESSVQVSAAYSNKKRTSQGPGTGES